MLNVQLDTETGTITGPDGSITVPAGDEVVCKLLMLLEGECCGLGAPAAAAKYGYSCPRYYQLRRVLSESGPAGLASEKRGPKTNYRRTDQVEREVIRLRFLDPDAPAAVVAQKLQQRGFTISLRSVERVIADYGLQKKTLQGPS